MFFERLTPDRQNSLKNYAIIEIRIKNWREAVFEAD
jgi:hypothetical protein